MRRSPLAQPGGFVPWAAVLSNLDLDPWCVFCYRSVDTGEIGEYAWLHVPTHRVVCGTCLPDPSAKGGAAGERMAERVAAVPNDEYEAQVW